MLYDTVSACNTDQTGLSSVPTWAACSQYAYMVLCWTSLLHASVCTVAQVSRLVLALQTVFIDHNFGHCLFAVDQGCCCFFAGQQQLYSIPHLCNDTKYSQSWQKVAIRMLLFL